MVADECEGEVSKDVAGTTSGCCCMRSTGYSSALYFLQKAIRASCKTPVVVDLSLVDGRVSTAVYVADVGCLRNKSFSQRTVRSPSPPSCLFTFAELRKDWARQKMTIEQLVRSDGEDRQVNMYSHIQQGTSRNTHEWLVNRVKSKFL